MVVFFFSSYSFVYRASLVLSNLLKPVHNLLISSTEDPSQRLRFALSWEQLRHAIPTKQFLSGENIFNGRVCGTQNRNVIKSLGIMYLP